jgi:thiaminase/transcriptional activator TenA
MSFFERLKARASGEWRAYTEHPFVNGMADGSLAETAFRLYLIQDYLFLIEFARAYAVAVYKSPTLADMREAAAGLSAILDVEMDLHVKLCAGWGLAPGDLEQAPPAPETLAYTRYVLDAGMRGDLLALKVALAPCVIGYAEIAARLAAHPGARAPTNPIVHGTEDRIVPAEHGRKQLDAAREPKRGVFIPNADHNDWSAYGLVDHVRAIIADLDSMRRSAGRSNASSPVDLQPEKWIDLEVTRWSSPDRTAP